MGHTHIHTHAHVYTRAHSGETCAHACGYRCTYVGMWTVIPLCVCVCVCLTHRLVFFKTQMAAAMCSQSVIHAEDNREFKVCVCVCVCVCMRIRVCVCVCVPHTLLATNVVTLRVTVRLGLTWVNNLSSPLLGILCTVRWSYHSCVTQRGKLAPCV